MDKAFSKIGNDFADLGHNLDIDDKRHHGIHPIRKLINHYKQQEYRHGN